MHQGQDLRGIVIHQCRRHTYEVIYIRRVILLHGRYHRQTKGINAPEVTTIIAACIYVFVPVWFCVSAFWYVAKLCIYSIVLSTFILQYCVGDRSALYT